VEKLVVFCETEGIRVQYALDLFDLKFAKAKQTDLNGFMLLTLERSPIKIGHLLIKRVFDVIFSGLLLLILLTLYVSIAIAVKVTSKGPVFFKQTRSGLNGRKFTLYKFRTMVVNAESLLSKLKTGNEMTGPVFKMKDDPRITPLGRYLRKFSLDELPQLWNVFKGEMSLVGPRPPLPDEVKAYDSWQRRRLCMRPGITCLWQVQGRNNITDFNEWARLDLEYIDNWSIWKDFGILFQTIPVVVFGVGAK
jgi:exopolysaccharide biosynthesis polyprenyl glycosylphosphotransferase